MRWLNSVAFWIGVLGCGLMILWFSLQPLEFLQMALTARHVEWRGLLGIAPQALAVILIMFAAPAAVRQFQDGRFRPAWLWLGVSYAGVLVLGYPVQWLVWKLLADF
ncbi:hypothetical protein QO010_002864 [Caulobacter ginsengisoli]|uniref:DUF2834 domain-containing protein n=1 Tax=Caulobacter ginsengisoli TaxID=400775 RepID=A0ABU0ISX1_9CAUL|nr:hypothetical protein [Caulobacter ginsengisoli]MDQ0465080.1 hypothetical protein [Caulobacter ginsengisoli]